VDKIKPFKAIVYNQEKIKDLSKVCCPPYDIISPQKQQYYHDISPYNFVHILLGKDTVGENKYRRANRYFKDWQKNKILLQDTRPAIYFYSQQYKLKGQEKIRLGFISLLHLEDRTCSVFGHEHTQIEPKEDRLRLLKQVKANLSPIFAVFMDNQRIIQRVYEQHIKNLPVFIDITDDEKVIHKLWRIESPEIINSIRLAISKENIFIADGHHRYEVACVFREQMKKRLGERLTQEEDFNYIMTYFTNANSKSASVLPIHRLLRSDKEINLESLIFKLKDYFTLDEIKEKNQFFFLLEKGGRTEHVIGMYKDKRYWLLRLKNINILDKLMVNKPKPYRSLDISILNTVIFKKILNIDPENKENLEFSPYAEEFIKKTDDNPLNIAFFLNPVKIEQIIQVALSGERMPPKSTYFYPKVLSGLVINKFEVRN
jgi:uncharacterized protein (DUF1015 family)